LPLLLDGEPKKEGEVLSLSTSGVLTCSSRLTAVSDCATSQLLNSSQPLQDFCERASAKQYSHQSAMVEDIRQFQPVQSPDMQELECLSTVSGDIRVNCRLSSSALSASDDVQNHDKSLLKMDHVEVLDISKEWIMNTQSLAVNSCLDTSDDSVVDTTSVMTDSGVDSSTLSSHLCLSEISSGTADVDPSASQEVARKPKRALHGRSASEGGNFRPSECFQNTSQHEYHQRYEQGTELLPLFLHLFI